MQNIVKSVVGYMYYISIFVAVIVLPFMLAKALVLFGHSDPESKARGRHLLTVAGQFAIVLAVLPPIIGLMLKLLTPLMHVPEFPSNSSNVTPINPVASGAGWVFSILLSLLSYIVVAIERIIKMIAANITLPLIYACELMDHGKAFSQGSFSLPLTRIWTFFFVIAIGFIIIGFLYNYITDIMKESVGEESAREGVNIMNYINRVVIALVAAVISYPIGKVILWLNSALEQFVSSYIQFPNMSTFFTASHSPVDFTRAPLTNSIAFMTLAPHTKEFLQNFNSVFQVTQGILSVFDLKQTIALGFFQSYSIFFLVAIALYFAMRIIMVFFWFGMAPVIFVVALGYKGKINALSAWIGNFFTWALFPSVVAIGVYITSQIITAMSSANLGIGVGYTSTFSLLLYGAAMVVIMRLPNMLKNVFTRFGEQFEAGAFMQGIIGRMKII